MNSTSPSARLVRIAARSPERSITGPLVVRMPVPSSAATMFARVVLPRPGGPDSRMWSGGVPRPIAPLSSSSSWSRTRCWAMKSASRRGRTLASASSSSSSASGETRSSPDRTSRRLIGCGPAAGSPGAAAPAPAAPRRRSVSATAATAWSACAADQPSASTPWRTCSCQAPPSTPAGAPSGRSATGPIRSRSSRTSRSAPFLPMPGTRVRAARSPPAMARRTASGWCTASTAWASRGPTPLAVWSSSNSCFSSSSAKPYRVSESSRTIRLVASRASAPALQPGEGAGRALDLQADPADLDHGAVRGDRGDHAAHAGDHRRLLLRPRAATAAACDPGAGAAAPDVADGEGEGVGGVGRPGRRVQARAAGSPSR